MAITTLGQHCTVFLDTAGVQRFKIESSVDSVLAGDLPIYGPSPYTSNIFVHKIIAPTDPKADTFLRVANVADLTTLPLGREVAVGLGQLLYMTTAFTVIYDDIATASQAKTLIQQRVDNLIADWHAYNEQFLAPLNAPPLPDPQTYSEIPFPLTASEEAARKALYNTAHANLLASKVTSAAAAATATATIAAASTANDAAASAVATSQQCSSMLGQLNGAITAADSFRGSVSAFAPTAVTFANASVVFADACTAFQAACSLYYSYGTPVTAPQRVQFAADSLTWGNALAAWNLVRASFDANALNTAIAAEAINGQPVLDALHTTMATACTAKIADVSIAASKKTAADLAAANAATAKKAADTAQSAASLADTEAYLSVKELCPDFLATTP